MKQGLLVLVIVILLLIVGRSYFKAGNGQSSLPLFTPTSTPTPTPDPTVGWKIYANQKYGYSVKYPPSLQMNESETSYDQYVEFTLGRDASGNAYLPNYTVTVAKNEFQAKDAASVNFLTADWTADFYTMRVGDIKTANTVTFKKLPNEKVAGQEAAVIQVTATGTDQKRYFLKNATYTYMISDFSHDADFTNLLSTFTLTK